jgi:hypothetical protein
MPDDSGVPPNPYTPPTAEASPKIADDKVRYVVFRYALSAFFFTYSGTSQVMAVGRGYRAWVRGLPYTLASLVFGWWGIPWGPIRTIQALATNFSGGEDVTYQANRAIHGVEDPDATWACPQCKSTNPNTTFRCICGYRLV